MNTIKVFMFLKKIPFKNLFTIVKILFRIIKRWKKIIKDVVKFDSIKIGIKHLKKSKRR